MVVFTLIYVYAHAHYYLLGLLSLASNKRPNECDKTLRSPHQSDLPGKLWFCVNDRIDIPLLLYSIYSRFHNETLVIIMKPLFK